ncbi:MAG: hypothetical protein RDA78_02980 [Roseibium sp.]|uniref:hypothetical protein n=1 Tax=Roseibium sp. TaxID=1936156 RepID=UPI003D9C5795
MHKRTVAVIVSSLIILSNAAIAKDYLKEGFSHNDYNNAPEIKDGIERIYASYASTDGQLDNCPKLGVDREKMNKWALFAFSDFKTQGKAVDVDVENPDHEYYYIYSFYRAEQTYLHEKDPEAYQDTCDGLLRVLNIEKPTGYIFEK